MSKSDVLIIGAGIIGLATAFQIQKRNPHLKITILEKECKAALHQTSRNSGVIHSGVYYRPGSLKAKNCVQGKKELLSFCEEHQVPFQKLGKVIVATKPEEIPRLKELERRGKENGLQYLRWVKQEELKEIEPNVNGLEALWISDASIIEFKNVADRLVSLLQKNGAEVCFQQQVTDISKENYVETPSQSYRADFVINCAGLFCDRIARKTLPKRDVPFQILPFRGEYYELKENRRNLVNGLIYPVPDPRFPFLGVHLTKMMNGGVEAGPNAVLATGREAYRWSEGSWKDAMELLSFRGFWSMAKQYWKMGSYELYRSLSKKAFVKSVQELMPCVQENDFVEGNRGIRAQLVSKDGRLVDDFALVEKKNMIHVLNAPSPAATASFSIGNHIAQRYYNQKEAI